MKVWRWGLLPRTHIECRTGTATEEGRAGQSPEYSGKRRQPHWQSTSLVKRTCLSELGIRTIKEGSWQHWASTRPCTWPFTHVQPPTHMPTYMHTWTDTYAYVYAHHSYAHRGQGTRTLLWLFMGVSPQRPLLFVVAPLSLSSPAPHSAEYRSSLWSISLTSRNPQVTLDRLWWYGYVQMSPPKANSMSQTCIKGTCSTELHGWATEHISVSCHRHQTILKDRTMDHGPPQRLKCKPPSLISTEYVLLPHLWRV